MSTWVMSLVSASFKWHWISRFTCVREKTIVIKFLVSSLKKDTTGFYSFTNKKKYKQWCPHTTGECYQGKLLWHLTVLNVVHSKRSCSNKNTECGQKAGIKSQLIHTEENIAQGYVEVTHLPVLLQCVVILLNRCNMSLFPQVAPTMHSR